MDTKKGKTPGKRLDDLGRWYYLSGAFGLILSCIIPATTANITYDLTRPPDERESRGCLGSYRYTPNSVTAEEQIANLSRRVVIFGSLATLLAWDFALLTAYAGRCLQKRKHPALVKTMAAWNLIWLPHGTALGLATFLALKAPEAKQQFAEK